MFIQIIPRLLKMLWSYFIVLFFILVKIMIYYVTARE